MDAAKLGYHITRLFLKQIDMIALEVLYHTRFNIKIIMFYPNAEMFENLKILRKIVQFACKWTVPLGSS